MEALLILNVTIGFDDSLNFAIVLYVFYLFSFCIAKGLAMCRLGAVISAQKVLF